MERVIYIENKVFTVESIYIMPSLVISEGMGRKKYDGTSSIAHEIPKVKLYIPLFQSSSSEMAFGVWGTGQERRGK